MKEPLDVGAVFTCRYPFVRVAYHEFDAECGPDEKPVASWRPGTDGMSYCPATGRETLIADGAGEAILTVVSVHKPGRFPTRVFFTRQWKTPDGKMFGKSKLHIVTADKFRRTATHYQHPWRVEDRGADAVLRASAAPGEGTP